MWYKCVYLLSIIGISLFEIGPPYSSPTRLRDENELKLKTDQKKNLFTYANVSLKGKPKVGGFKSNVTNLLNTWLSFLSFHFACLNFLDFYACSLNCV